MVAILYFEVSHNIINYCVILHINGTVSKAALDYGIAKR